MSEEFTGADFSAAGGDTSPASAPTDSAAPVAPSTPEGAATTAPVEGTAVSSADPAKAGPIPFDAHKTALDNARAKAVAEWDQQYGWAKQVNRDQLAQMAQYFQKAQSEPTAFLSEYLKHIAETNPQAIAQLRSEFARQLASGRSQGGAPDLSRVEIDLGNGQTLSLGELQQQWTAQVMQQLQPTLQSVKDVTAERAQLKAVNDAHQFAQSTTADVFTWQGMDDPANRVAVRDYVKNLQLQSDDPRDLKLAVEAGYRATVLPKLIAAANRTTLHTNNQKASVTGAVPNAGSSASPKELKDMDWADALKHASAAAGL